MAASKPIIRASCASKTACRSAREQDSVAPDLPSAGGSTHASHPSRTVSAEIHPADAGTPATASAPPIPRPSTPGRGKEPHARRSPWRRPKRDRTSAHMKRRRAQPCDPDREKWRRPQEQQCQDLGRDSCQHRRTRPASAIHQPADNRLECKPEHVVQQQEAADFARCDRACQGSKHPTGRPIRRGVSEAQERSSSHERSARPRCVPMRCGQDAGVRVFTRKFRRVPPAEPFTMVFARSAVQLRKGLRGVG